MADTPLRSSLYINGAWVTTPNTLTVTDPTTGAPLATFADASPEDVNAAVSAATAAFPGWAALTDAARGGWLRKLSAGVAAAKERIAAVEARNCGKPFREACGDIDDVIACFAYCATLAEAGKGLDHIQPLPGSLPPDFATSVIRYEPLGVVAAITPFNFPAMMAAWKVGHALAAGCVVVLKPSEHTPFSTLELAAVAHEVGLPAGVLSVVTGAGAVGAALSTHPSVDKVSFTGSGPTGSRVMAAAAATLKRVTLELGGKSPVLVFDDASMAAAVEWVLFGGACAGCCGDVVHCMRCVSHLSSFLSSAGFFNAGQICSATSRVLVQAGIADEFTSRLVAAAKSIVVGGPFTEGVEMGPSICKMQFDKVAGYIATTIAEGAPLLTGGGRPAGDEFKTGFWTAPTIFKVTTKNVRVVVLRGVIRLLPPSPPPHDSLPTTSHPQHRRSGARRCLAR